MRGKADKSLLPGVSSRLTRTLRRLTYHPHVQSVARGLHLSNFLRSCYQRLTGGKQNILKVEFRTFNALFQVHSALLYRTMEQAFMAYERDFIDPLLGSLAEGDVFLDVGCSVGLFTVPIAKVVGQRGLVIAVEPEAVARAQLEANVKLNALSNVRVLAIALGDQSGEGSLAWKDGSCPSLVSVSPGDHKALSESIPSSLSGCEVVQVEAGDEVIERGGLPVPNAIKVDVEGYECQVIRGLRRTLTHAACRLLCCEVHPPHLPRGTTPQRIAEDVKTLGFTDIVLVERGGQVHMIARKNSRPLIVAPSQEGTQHG